MCTTILALTMAKRLSHIIAEEEYPDLIQEVQVYDSNPNILPAGESVETYWKDVSILGVSITRASYWRD